MIRRLRYGSLHPLGRDIPPAAPIAGPLPRGRVSRRSAREVQRVLRITRAIDARLNMDAQQRREVRGRDEP